MRPDDALLKLTGFWLATGGVCRYKICVGNCEQAAPGATVNCIGKLPDLLDSQQTNVKHLSSLFLLATSLLLLTPPAQAAKLESWRFDAGQNRLEITTDDDVQPTAQLIFDPVRLVIDLPGVKLGRPVINQAMNGAIRSIRIGQFDRETTRIVVEMAPGYTLDPQQVRFRGITSRYWTVQLPAPQPVPIDQARAAGYVVPSVAVGAGNNDRPNLPGRLGSLIPPAAASTPAIATIQSIELVQDNQLLIQADQPIAYSTGWDRATGFYRISINSARFANNLRGPQLNASSPIRNVRLRQDTAETAVILLQPAAGVQLGAMSQPTQRMLTLQLQKNRPIGVPPAFAGVPPGLPPTGNTPMPDLAQVPRGQVVIMIDPGHGGPDPGAVGIGGIQEKEIVLDISKQVAQYLQQQGVQAILTRENDIDLDLQPRVDMAERVNATLFVSIHANAIDMSRPDVSGLETYYFSSGQQLARTIHRSVIDATGIQDRGIRTARFFVLRKTSMPSVLVEVGFVTGRDDAAKLSTPSYRSQMAAGIARGILQYLRQGL